MEIGLRRPWSIKKQIENKIDHEVKIEKIYSTIFSLKRSLKRKNVCETTDSLCEKINELMQLRPNDNVIMTEMSPLKILVTSEIL